MRIEMTKLAVVTMSAADIRKFNDDFSCNLPENEFVFWFDAALELRRIDLSKMKCEMSNFDFSQIEKLADHSRASLRTVTKIQFLATNQNAVILLNLIGLRNNGLYDPC